MDKTMYGSPDTANQTEQMSSSIDRRNFLRSAGLAAAAGSAFMAGCTMVDHPFPAGTIDLGSGDVGILNYAYALEQLEAAFYTLAIDAADKNMISSSDKLSMMEYNLLKDIRDHEIIHRDFFKAALQGAAIPTLGVGDLNFPADTFSSRTKILQMAKLLEDTGVAAYNGAGILIQDPGYLLLAGKIVSVEARHAAYIRFALNSISADFAGDDVVEPMTGLDKLARPDAILMAVQPLLKVKLSGANLPKP
jgi:hypothetical protein